MPPDVQAWLEREGHVPPKVCQHTASDLEGAIVSTEFRNGKMCIVSSVVCRCGAGWTGTAYDAVKVC